MVFPLLSALMLFAAPTVGCPVPPDEGFAKVELKGTLTVPETRLDSAHHEDFLGWVSVNGKRIPVYVPAAQGQLTRDAAAFDGKTIHLSGRLALGLGAEDRHYLDGAVVVDGLKPSPKH